MPATAEKRRSRGTSRGQRRRMHDKNASREREEDACSKAAAVGQRDRSPDWARNAPEKPRLIRSTAAHAGARTSHVRHQKQQQHAHDQQPMSRPSDTFSSSKLLRPHFDIQSTAQKSHCVNTSESQDKIPIIKTTCIGSCR